MSSATLTISTPKSCRVCQVSHLYTPTNKLYCYNNMQVTEYNNTRHPDCPLKITLTKEEALAAIDINSEEYKDFIKTQREALERLATRLTEKHADALYKKAEAKRKQYELNKPYAAILDKEIPKELKMNDTEIPIENVNFKSYPDRSEK